MGVSRVILLEEANKILGEPLDTLGYKLQRSLLSEGNWSFWFEKHPQIVTEPSRILKFLPYGLHLTDLFLLSVDLHRSYNEKYLDDARIKSRDKVWDVPLAPFIWETKGEGDHNWGFKNIEELETALIDILDKLTQHGIPYLEDPNSIPHPQYRKR